jgi:hypothetical protein
MPAHGRRYLARCQIGGQINDRRTLRRFRRESGGASYCEASSCPSSKSAPQADNVGTCENPRISDKRKGRWNHAHTDGVGGPSWWSDPAVFFLMDAYGVREELKDMARRLATVGYYVLLPTFYYRAGRDTIYGPDVRPSPVEWSSWCGRVARAGARRCPPHASPCLLGH